MISEAEVRERALAFLQNEFSLNDFEDWLAARSWNMHRDSAPSAQDLVSSIELALFEHSNGHARESDLRSALMSLLDDIVLSVAINVDVPRISPVRFPAFAANAYQVRPRQAVVQVPA
jgi:hypothetical protein